MYYLLPSFISLCALPWVLIYKQTCSRIRKYGNIQSVAYEDYCRIPPEEDALVENMMQEKAKMAEVAAARESHTLFHHEHVGVKNEQQRGLLVKE